MAIIDRPNKEGNEEDPKSPSGIITPPKVEVPTDISDDFSYQTTAKPRHSGKGVFTVFKWVLLIVLLAGGVVLAYPYFQNVKFESNIKTENIVLEVDRLIRIDSVIALLEKKIHQNQSTLQRSEEFGDKVLVDTMRLALSQNLIDLEKHQDSYIDVLMNITTSYQTDSGKVVSALKNQLKASSDSYKLGRVNTITQALELMESIPKDKEPKAYFSEKIKQQKK